MSPIYYNDILAESLAFGKRRELAMLEATNRRIHSIVDCWLSEAPFLVFDLKYKYRSKTSKFRRILVDPFAEFVPKDNFPCEQELYASVLVYSQFCHLKERNRLWVYKKTQPCTSKKRKKGTPDFLNQKCSIF